MHAAARAAAPAMMAVLALRGALASRQEELLAAASAAAIASEELFATQPGCREAAGGRHRGSPQALKRCVESLQHYVAEVHDQSMRSQEANQQYAADIERASELLRRLQAEQREHQGRFKALGQELRAAAALDGDSGGASAAGGGAPSLQHEPDAEQTADERPRDEDESLSQSPARHSEDGSEDSPEVSGSVHVVLDNRGRLHAGGSRSATRQRGTAASPRSASEEATASERSVARAPSPSSELQQHRLGRSDVTAASISAHRGDDGDNGELAAGSEGEPPAVPGDAQHEASVVAQLHREARRTAEVAGRLEAEERGGAGTVGALESDLKSKEDRASALRAQLEEQRQATERAQELSERSGNETAKQRQVLRRLEAEHRQAQEARDLEQHKLEDLRRKAVAAADSSEAARAAAEETVRAVTEKKQELRDAINHLNDLQDQLAELRAGAAGPEQGAEQGGPSPSEDQNSWGSTLGGIFR